MRTGSRGAGQGLKTWVPAPPCAPQMAFRYLSWILFPLLGCYAVYSLLYLEHKGWYSWVLSMLYGFLLTFGEQPVLRLAPQLGQVLGWRSPPSTGPSWELGSDQVSPALPAVTVQCGKQTRLPGKAGAAPGDSRRNASSCVGG